MLMKKLSEQLINELFSCRVWKNRNINRALHKRDTINIFSTAIGGGQLSRLDRHNAAFLTKPQQQLEQSVDLQAARCELFVSEGRRCCGSHAIKSHA